MRQRLRLGPGLLCSAGVALRGALLRRKGKLISNAGWPAIEVHHVPALVLAQIDSTPGKASMIAKSNYQVAVEIQEPRLGAPAFSKNEFKMLAILVYDFLPALDGTVDGFAIPQKFLSTRAAGALLQ